MQVLLVLKLKILAYSAQNLVKNNTVVDIAQLILTPLHLKKAS